MRHGTSSPGKVDDVDKVAFLPEAHEEVVWFDVTVDEVL